MVSERSEEFAAENLDSAESLDEATIGTLKLIAERLTRRNGQKPDLLQPSYGCQSSFLPPSRYY
jgi:hypothetical protein